MVDEHQLKRPRTGTGPPTDYSRQLPPTQVTSSYEKRDEQSTCVNGTDPLFGDLAGPNNLGRNYGHLDYGTEGILVESWRSQAPIQEGMN